MTSNDMRQVLGVALSGLLEGSHLAPGQRTPGIVCGRNAPCPCGSGRKFKACCICKPAANVHDSTNKGA